MGVKRVALVIGGGAGGLIACTGLRKVDKDVEIILVEPKDYMEVLWATYRAFFDEDIADKSLLAIEPWAQTHNIQHIRTTVTELTDDRAVLSNGDVVEFTVCVVATGATSQWSELGRGVPTSDWNTRTKRKELLLSSGKEYLNAESIIIIGGGLIGVEMAGDIKCYAQQLQQQKGEKKIIQEPKVTLIHSKGTLIPEFTPGAAAMTKKKLEAMGVEVVLNEKASVDNDQGVKKVKLQTSGKVLTGTKVLMATGVSPINNFMDKKYLNENGWLQVDENFKVKGSNYKLFGFGDCCDLLPNAANVLLSNVHVIGGNLKVALDHHTGDSKQTTIAKAMKKAVPFMGVYLATIGTQTGVGQTPMFYTQRVLPYIKNKTMFFSKLTDTIQYPKKNEKSKNVLSLLFRTEFVLICIGVSMVLYHIYSQDEKKWFLKW